MTVWMERCVCCLFVCIGKEVGGRRWEGGGGRRGVGGRRWEERGGREEVGGGGWEERGGREEVGGEGYGNNVL